MMVNEPVNVSWIKLKGYVKYSKQNVQLEAIEINLAKPIKFFTKKEHYAIWQRFLTQPKKGFLIYGLMVRNMYLVMKFLMLVENFSNNLKLSKMWSEHYTKELLKIPTSWQLYMWLKKWGNT